MAADGTRQADKARRELDIIRRALAREMKAIVSRMVVVDGTLSGDAMAAMNAQRVRSQLLTIIGEGRTEMERVLDEQLAAVIKAVMAEHDLGDFSPSATATIEDVRAGALTDILSTVGDGSERMGDAVRVALTTGAQIDDLIEELSQDIDTTMLRAQAAVDAAVMAAGRKVVVESGKALAEQEGLEVVYRYTGPLDRKTRPFCRPLIGKCFTLSALDAMTAAPGQPGPVSLFCGGYNCRHTLAPMTLEDAVAYGYEVVR